jgi:hypothetical protein
MLNSSILQYIITPKERSDIWTQGYVLFARLKNNMVVFTNARKERMDMPSNVKFVDSPKVENITSSVQKFVLQSMKDGQKEILKRFSKIKELITKETRKKSLISFVNQERKMDMQIQKHTGKEIEIKSNAIILCDSQLNLVNLLDQRNVRDVITVVSHKLITMITQSPWTLSGFVENVMEKSTELFYQRERLSLETS